MRRDQLRGSVSEHSIIIVSARFNRERRGESPGPKGLLTGQALITHPLVGRYLKTDSSLYPSTINPKCWSKPGVGMDTSSEQVIRENSANLGCPAERFDFPFNARAIADLMQ